MKLLPSYIPVILPSGVLIVPIAAVCQLCVVAASSETFHCFGAVSLLRFMDQYWSSELTQWKAIFINNEQDAPSHCPDFFLCVLCKKGTKWRRKWCYFLFLMKNPVVCHCCILKWKVEFSSNTTSLSLCCFYNATFFLLVDRIWWLEMDIACVCSVQFLSRWAARLLQGDSSSLVFQEISVAVNHSEVSPFSSTPLNSTKMYQRASTENSLSASSLPFPPPFMSGGRNWQAVTAARTEARCTSPR